jgi:hypothetical protein
MKKITLETVFEKQESMSGEMSRMSKAISILSKTVENMARTIDSMSRTMATRQELAALRRETIDRIDNLAASVKIGFDDMDQKFQSMISGPTWRK